MEWLDFTPLFGNTLRSWRRVFSDAALSQSIMPRGQRAGFTKECREARLGLWECPPFLFIVLGAVIIVSMLATYVIASRYTDEPEVAALIVIFITLALLVVGHFIITGFNRMAEANRMKSEFIAIVSHQLRSPLSVIKWTLDAAARARDPAQNQPAGGPPGNPLAVKEQMLDTVSKTTDYMIRLVNSLLEVSRIEARTLTLKKEAVPLEDLVKSILQGFKSYAAASNITFNFGAAPGLAPVWGDRDRIMGIVQNLVDNAIRYSRGGGKVEVSLFREGGYQKVTVRDDGVGIPSQDQPDVFKKFFRAQNSMKYQTEGTGIGLYTAKALTEAMGGKMGFESEEGKGSTFWFTLPIKI